MNRPRILIIDEIGTELEAQAARTLAERGVQLIGTAHGNNLDNLMLNPALSDLIGGIQSVTLGDEEARRELVDHFARYARHPDPAVRHGASQARGFLFQSADPLP